MIRNIIFDFDGTLGDSFAHICAIYNAHAASWKCKPLAPEDLKELRRRRPQDVFREYGLHWWKLPKIISTIHKEFRHNTSEVTLFAGVSDMIHTLAEQGMRLYVVSSNSVENIEEVLRRFELLTYFSGVHSERSIYGKHKMLQSLLRKEHLEPSETIYVGDETRDVEAAKKAGLQIVACCWGFQDRSMLEVMQPKFLAETPEDIISFLGTD